MSMDNDTLRLNHSIGLSSAANARQLGGYICADGRKIKDGVLLRSGALNLLSDADARILVDTYRLKNVVDFRMKHEKAMSPDKTVEGCEYHWFTVYDNFSYSDEAITKMSKMLGQQKSGSGGFNISPKAFDIIVKNIKNKDVTNMYSEILLCDDGMKGYAGFLKIVLDNPDGGAVLWHCSQGKDRAGLAAALLLYALGASDETVKRDYLLSNEFYAEDIAKIKAAAERYDLTPDEKRELLMLSGVDEYYLDLALGGVKKEFGTIRAYLNHIGISDSDIEVLRDKYLEK